MPSREREPREPRLRRSGYASRVYELGYGIANPFYDLIVWLGLIPVGGEPACRRLFARWCRLVSGQRVASLCCGTGRTEQAMLRQVPDLEITGVDLGRGQLATARRRNGERMRYLRADVSASGLADGVFDRVVIAFALHEMPRELRLRVLREARRLCHADGLVVAIEHGHPRTPGQRFLQHLCWGFWLPGNPEAATSRDLRVHGLDREMVEAGMQVVERCYTRPDWIEGVVARP